MQALCIGTVCVCFAVLVLNSNMFIICMYVMYCMCGGKGSGWEGLNFEMFIWFYGITEINNPEI